MSKIDFLGPPFHQCPRCQAEESFGVSMRLDPTIRSYHRVCRKCRHTEERTLPPVATKLVYLDQPLISQVMKALHPEKRERFQAADYWLTVFDALDRACRLQILTCPFSDIQTRESIPMAEFFKPMESIFRHFSRGIRFRAARQIKELQLREAAKNWASGKTPLVTTGDASAVVDGDLGGWAPTIDLKVNITWPAEVLSEVANDTAARDQAMANCRRYWAEHPEHLEDTFRAEVEGFAGAVREAGPSGLLPAIVVGLREGGIGDRRSAVDGFLRPEIVSQVPFVRLQALLYAGIARRVAHGQKTPLKASFTYDVEAASLFLPYCDALFVDSAFRSLLTENPVAGKLGADIRIFAAEDPGFLTYLSSLTDGAPTEQRLVAEDLYGSLDLPFRSLLEL